MAEGLRLRRPTPAEIGLIVALLLFAALAGFTAVQTLRSGFVPTYDEANYEAMVKHWLASGVYGYYAPITGLPDATVTPGLPLLLVPFYAVWGAANAGGPYAAIFAMNIVFGLLALWGVWWLARDAAGGKAAVIAALALAVYPTFFRLPARVLTEVPSAAAFVLFLVAMTAALRRSDLRLALGAGACATLSVMVRPSFGPMVLVVLLWMWFSAKDRRGALRLAGASAGVLGVALALWVGSNALTLHRLTLIESRGEPVLAGIDPWYRESGGTYRYGPSYARFVAEGKPVEASQYAMTALAEHLRTDPARTVAWFTIGKTDYIFFRSAAAFGKTSLVVGSVWSVYHYVFMVLGFAGLALAVRFRPLVPLSLAFVVGWAGLLTLVPEARYAFGLLPLMAVAGAVLLVRAWGTRGAAGSADGARPDEAPAR